MSNAERQRRYRERKREQEKSASAAAASVTPSVTPPVTGNAVTPDTSGRPALGPRGDRLWRDITDEGGQLKPGERVLLEEACRLADRLDRLDQILLGTADDWLRFHAANEDGTVVKVIVSGALVEVRQQQTTLARLLAELRTSRSAGAGRPNGRVGSQPSSKGGGAGVTDIAARIAARRGKAAG